MGSVTGLGQREAEFIQDPGSRAGPASASRLAEALAEHDDVVLAAYLDDRAVTADDWLDRKLAGQVRDALVHPVFFGSASTGAGVDTLLHALARLLPVAGGDPGGPVSGRVFKVERGAAGDKVAYARLFSGTIAVRDRVRFGDGKEGKVTAVSVFAEGAAVRRGSVPRRPDRQAVGPGGGAGRRRARRGGAGRRGRSLFPAAHA